MKYFEIKYKVSGTENIPEAGRYIFVSNHPLGGLDGLVFIYELSKHFHDIKFPVNDILTNIENLSGIFLPVNKHGAQGKDAARRLKRHMLPTARSSIFRQDYVQGKREVS